jgi:hypothetical protein
MKKLSFFLLIIGALLINTVSAQNVAVFYTNDDEQTVAGAAILQIKFEATIVYDIDGLDSAHINDLIAGIAETSLHKIFVLVDTATNDADNKIQGYLSDSLEAKLFTDDTLDYTPDTAIVYVAATATKYKSEVVWNRSDVYTGKTEPLIIKYLGKSLFSAARGVCSGTGTDSTLVNSAAAFTSDAFDIGYYVYLTAGTGIGQSRDIYDGNTTTLYVTPDWTTIPTSTSYYTVKLLTQQNEFFYDIYAKLYVLTYLSDLDDGTVKKNWKKLIDKQGNLNSGNVYRTPYQDLTYLFNTVIAGGKTIFDYLKL